MRPLLIVLLFALSGSALAADAKATSPDDAFTIVSGMKRPEPEKILGLSPTSEKSEIRFSTPDGSSEGVIIYENDELSRLTVEFKEPVSFKGFKLFSEPRFARVKMKKRGDVRGVHQYFGDPKKGQIWVLTMESVITAFHVTEPWKHEGKLKSFDQLLKEKAPMGAVKVK